MVEWIVSITGACVSIATATFGYFKLVKSSRMETIEERVKLWQERTQLVELQLKETQEKLEKFKLRLETCEEDRGKLQKDVYKLMQELHGKGNQ